jgi:hypothetical protein
MVWSRVVAVFSILGDVLRYEKLVVSELTTTTDPARRVDVASFVDGALRSMPEHLRAALVAASLVLDIYGRVVQNGRPSVHSLDTSPIPQLRQYVRVFRSLVLFAENELPASSRPVLVAT